MHQRELKLSHEYIAGFFDGEGSIGIYSAVKEARRVRFHLRTQVTQNVSPEVDEIFASLRAMYGGNLNVMDRRAARHAYNWQLNGHGAVAFLSQIEPHLRLKRDQARFAIAWQRQRPPVVRNERGHIGYKEQPVMEFDVKVGRLIKALKIAHLDMVMAQQADLVEVVHTLRQVMCIKGN